MGLDELLEKYEGIKNGQDLIEAGVIPKTASEMMTLIAYERLRILKETISSTLDESLIGKWVPAAEKKGSNYALRTGVIAEEKLGHKIKIAKEFTGKNWDKDGQATNMAIPEGAIGNLRACETNGKSNGYALTITFDENISGRKIYRFKLDDLAEQLEVSSLGQFLPRDKEQLVYEQAMYEFFPRAKLDTDRTSRVITGMLMSEKDMIFYGPPGSGKSTLCRDITKILKQHIGIRFEVDGCRFGCNPYSLFDEEFAKIIPPCPDCMIKHNGNKTKDYYKKTGIFIPPRPKDVPVVIAQFGPGHGCSYVESTEETRRRHLIGQKIPRLDGTTDAEMEDQRSPEGFTPGSITDSNNGVVHIEELDKLRPQSLASLLEVNSNHRVQPDDLKFELPCRNIIITTANDPTALPDPIKDRFFALAIRYHEDVKTAQKMVKDYYANQQGKAMNLEIGDVYGKRQHILKNIVMPITLLNAITSFEYKFRNEYSGAGKQDILGSGRALEDAVEVSRAELLKDSLFFKRTPQIVNTEYAIRGLQFALCGRIATNSRQEDKKIKEELRDWARQNYPALQKEEENTWCCEFFNQHLAVLKTQIPEIEANFFQEMETYAKDPRLAEPRYKAVKQAHDNPNNTNLQDALIENPFMEYLFIDQPGMKTIQPAALVQLIDYFSQAYQNSACKINPSS